MRLKRHARVRTKLSGTAEKPRLNVYRSNKHIYAQIIDDVKGETCQASSKIKISQASTSKVDSNYCRKQLLKSTTKVLKKSYLIVAVTYTMVV